MLKDNRLRAYVLYVLLVSNFLLAWASLDHKLHFASIQDLPLPPASLDVLVEKLYLRKRRCVEVTERSEHFHLVSWSAQ